MRIPFEGGVLHGKAIDLDDPPSLFYGNLLDGDVEKRSTYVLDRWERDGEKHLAYRARELSDEELQALERTASKE